MSKRLYMHTIDGKPAKFDKEGYIYFVHSWSRVKASEMFVGSLETIKRQQAIDQKWRNDNGLAGEFIYRYIVIKDDRYDQP